MAETEKKTTYKVGDTMAVKPAGIVIRPDGSTHIVIRGTFYLDQPGKFLVDGTEVMVK
ncbi:hypothetical protein ENKNEFLB_02828 [Nocardioides aquaticus]|uniref:Uncharacterized protein n=1 Tax=Nocardioides aquaticus TaxID=160826 RepID=A0ABX8EP37_9ACTN|nr:hypothetical protein [Nocardioides aquaticus]QVT80433.1 hypothetical protein ENKNEFLB_02828 [Nocardioides aquaticus]